MKTQFINQLPKATQNSIRYELEQVGLSKEDITSAMESRLTDLEDTIDITMFDPMFVSVKQFMRSVDRNGDWMNANYDEKGYMLETIQDWIDSGLEMNPRIKGYMEYLGE